MEFIYQSDLNDSQLRAVQSETHIIWGAGKKFEVRFQTLMKLLKWQQGRWLRMSGLVDGRGRVLCSLKRYTLGLVNHLGERQLGVGIGALFTTLEARRQGLAAELIRQVFSEAKREGASCALLYSDIDPFYYEQFGFKRLPAKKDTIQAADLGRIGVPWQARRATDVDEPWMVSCYERSWPKGILRVSRTRESWNFFRFKNAHQDLEEWIFSEGKVHQGYLRMIQKHDCFIIDEIARNGEGSVDAAQFTARVWSTVREWAMKRHVLQIHGWLRDEYRPPGSCVQDRKTEIPMVATFNERQFDLSKFDLDQASIGSFDYF